MNPLSIAINQYKRKKALVLLLDLLKSNRDIKSFEISDLSLTKFDFTTSKQFYKTVYAANVLVREHLHDIDLKLVWEDEKTLIVYNGFDPKETVWSRNFYNFALALEFSMQDESEKILDQRLMRVKDLCLILAALTPLLLRYKILK